MGGTDRRFDVAGLFVVIIARQAAFNILDRIFRQDGNPVIGFLAVNRDVIAKILDFHCRKTVIDRLGFL